MDRVPSAETTERLLAHTAWLTRVARAITATEDDADDVVQETWLRALERPPTHRGNLKGWLATLARNLVRSRRRSSERAVARVKALPRREPEREPEESVARAELQQLLLDAVLALAEPYRSTLVMRFLDGLSADEIANNRGEPIETVRTRIKRGLDQVRARVAQKLGAEREQLPALLTPLLAAGAVAVTSTTKVGLLIGVAAVALATTLVLTHAEFEGGARGDESAARSPAPAEEAAAKQTGAAPAVARREVETGTEKAASSPASSTFDLVGTVVDSSGAPVADAMVALFDAESRQIRDTSTFVMDCLMSRSEVRSIADELRRTREAVRTTVTDVHGEFAMAGLARSCRGRVGAFHATGGWTELTDVAPPADSASSRVTLALLAGILVHGRVVDADGHPAPESGISFGIARAGHLSVHATSESARDSGITSGPDGTFAIPPVPADTLNLFATDAAGKHRSDSVNLRADDGVAIHEVTLLLASAPFCVELHGRVLGPDHQPLTVNHPFKRNVAEWAKSTPGSRPFHVWPIHGELPKLGEAGWRLTDPPRLLVGSSRFDDATGTYVCRAPLDEEFIPTCIAVIARDVVIAVEPLDEEPLRAADGTLDGPDLVIESLDDSLKPANAALLVRLVDAATRGPVVGTPTITFLMRSDSGGSSKCSNDGATSEPQIIPPGRCAVIANCSGYVPDWAAGDYAARAESYVITLALRRAIRSVRGVVVDPDEKPVANARVAWLCEDGTKMRATALEPVNTDADGRFEFEAVAATRGRLAIESDSLVPTFVDVVSGEEELTPRVELKRGVAVTFTCASTADGDPPGGNLRILQSDGSIVREDWSAPFSRPSLKWPRTLTLAPGKYRYRVEFVTRADDDGEFVASDGAQVVVTPHAR